jgi:hypothetical protein
LAIASSVRSLLISVRWLSPVSNWAKRGGSSTFQVIMISFQSTAPHFQCGVGARSYRTYRPSCRSLKMYGPVPAGRVS